MKGIYEQYANFSIPLNKSFPSGGPPGNTIQHDGTCHTAPPGQHYLLESWIRGVPARVVYSIHSLAVCFISSSVSSFGGNISDPRGRERCTGNLFFFFILTPT